ncbi:MAG: sialidase family protein [Muribaculaceae bacterium]
MKIFKTLLCSAVAVSLMPCFGLSAQTVLFESDSANHVFYRIPAIVKSGKTLLYLADDRSGVTDATAWGDIGSEGNISIIARRSLDCGLTWQPCTQIVVAGKGDAGFDRGHGDAAVVCDHVSGDMLMMCASGDVSYGRSNVKVNNGTLDLSRAQRVGRYYSRDGGYTWQGDEITAEMYGIYDNAATGKVAVTRMFFASGRICQSQIIKHGSHYRIYSVLTTNQGSLVVYSDDFGQRWLPLGGADARPAPDGDEAKVEELPDGSVLLSCRMYGGRYFNIFSYASTADASGSWAKPVASTSLNGGTATQNNATNGEILIVPARDRAGNCVYVALQSTPFGSHEPLVNNIDRRCNVSIYWKVLATAADYAKPECFLNGWTRFGITDKRSSYSTMVLDANGNIAFAYEDNGLMLRVGSQHTDIYDITFRSLSLSEITGGAYTYSASKTHRENFLKKR